MTLHLARHFTSIVLEQFASLRLIEPDLNVLSESFF